MIILVALIFILVCFKWGDWKNWKIYYPTILFLIATDFIHAYLCATKPLFRFTAVFIPGVISNLITNLIIYPCIIMLFLPYYNKIEGVKKIQYIALWVFIYFSLEYIGVKYGYYAYYNGWGFGWAFLCVWMFFALAAIHQRHPLLAWLIYFTFTSSVLTYLGIPLSH